MMAQIMNTTLIVDAHATIGEGPAWDKRDGALFWVDIPAGRIHKHAPDEAGKWQSRLSMNVDGACVAAIPRAGGGFLYTAGHDIMIAEPDGCVRWLCSIDPGSATGRLNEGKCDPQGRFWIGSMSMEGKPEGALHIVHPDGRAEPRLDGITISNGLDWSPDGSTFYYVDSLTMGIDAFDFDATDGRLSRRRRLVTIGRGEGLPDGLTVDREGGIWLAMFLGSEVRRYSPEGELLAILSVSAHQTTSCAFGGSDGGDLVITTANTPVPGWLLETIGAPTGSDAAAMVSPGAGGLFLCRPGVCGPTAYMFSG